MIDLKFKEEVNHYSNEINKVSLAVSTLIPPILMLVFKKNYVLIFTRGPLEQFGYLAADLLRCEAGSAQIIALRSQGLPSHTQLGSGKKVFAEC